MGDYQLRKSESGKYQQFACTARSDHLVRSVTMYGFGDAIDFFRKNRDGSTYGSMWSLTNLGCFPELGAYERLRDLRLNAVRQLAIRMSRLLFDTGARAKPILEELLILQQAQNAALKSGRITFPAVSAEELAAKECW